LYLYLGFDVLKEIRKTSDVPVIMLTARQEEVDRLKGFETGADDYVVKPFSPREIAFRIKAQFRRQKYDGMKEENESKNEDDSKKDKAKDNTKQVALTFDDGPDPEVTTAILATLKKYDAKATFFMLGSRVEYYPEIAKKVEKSGHELGNHTWNHPDLTKASSNKVNSEIAKTSTIIKDVTGKNATVFRPPYGAANDSVRAQTDLPSILWDVDTLDWKHRNADELLRIVKSSTQDGSIILMHDIHQSTADGLDSVLAHLKKEGFTFVTVSELD